MASVDRASTAQPDDRLTEFNKQLEQAYDYAKEENAQFKKYYQLVYKSSLTDDDKNALQSDDRPTFNFPILKPYLMQQLKNIVDSMPSVSFKAYEEDEINAAEMPNDMPALMNEDVADILTFKLQDIYERSKWADQVYAGSKDAFVGGKGVFKVKTEYINNATFAQEILIEAHSMPQNVYFDPAAKEVTKSDANYVVEMIPFSETAFKDKFGNAAFEEVERSSGSGSFPWVQQGKGDKEKTIWICEHYKKNVTMKTLYLLENGMTTFEPIEGIPVAEKREVEDVEISMIRYSKNVVIEEEKALNFKGIPFSLCAGEIYYDNQDKKSLPFCKPAIDAQRVKNFNMNFFLYEALSNRTGTDYIPQEALTDTTLDAIQNPTRKKLVVYKQFQTLKDGTRVELQPPRYEPAAPLPVQYLEAFSAMDGTIDKIMGSQYSSVDQMDSGKALFNLADYLSASNEGFMQNLLLAITHVSEIVLGAMPKTLSSQKVNLASENSQDDEIIEYAFDFDPSAFHVAIKRGVNYKLQQQATIEQLINLAEVSQPFAEFLYSEGMIYLLENMSLNQKDKLVQAFQSFQEQQQQQPPQPDPALISAQAKMMDSQVKAQELPLKEQTVVQKANAARMKFISDTDRSEAELAKAHMKLLDTVSKHPATTNLLLPNRPDPFYMN